VWSIRKSSSDAAMSLHSSVIYV